MRTLVVVSLLFWIGGLVPSEVSAKTVDIEISGTADAGSSVGFATCENLLTCGTYTGASPSPTGPCQCWVGPFFSAGTTAEQMASGLASSINGDAGCQSESVSAAANGALLTVDLPADRYCYLHGGEMLSCGGPGNSMLQLEGCTINNVCNGTTCDENGTQTGGLSFSTVEPSWTLEMRVRDDIPSPVQVRAESRTMSGVLTSTQDVYFELGNDGFRVQSVSVPVGTERIRLKFMNDFCGIGCPENEDVDRNLHVDWIRLNGVLAQGEDFDREYSPTYACAPHITYDEVEEVDVPDGTCGEQGAWMEWDFASPSSPAIPVMGAVGRVVFVLLLMIASGTALFRLRAERG